MVVSESGAVDSVGAAEVSEATVVLAAGAAVVVGAASSSSESRVDEHQSDDDRDEHEDGDDRSPSFNLSVAIGTRRAGWLHVLPPDAGALSRCCVVPQVALYHVGVGQHVSRRAAG